MTQRNTQPLPWRARGISDTIDGSTSFNGAMTSLSNLIPDPTTAQLWQCRPAAVPLVTFGQITAGPFSSGFSPGFQQQGLIPSQGTVSVFKNIGSLIYGMVGSVAGGDGFDHPFCFNIATNSFITVTGSMTGTLPAAQPTTGPWIPPIMDLIGSRLMVAHFGFDATPFMLGWFDLSNPLAPVWHAGTLTGLVPLQQPPIAVAQFAGRAYYIVNLASQPAVIFSDVLNALNCTNANQVLTFGDNTPLTAFGQLRLFNQLGGIIQALIVFKGTQNIYQITGDASLGNLALNAMNFATGTLAPNSICSTPKGLMFVAPDGMRLIDFSANISDPIGYDGKGIAAPFIYSNVPSRICAACNGNVIRISTQNQLQVNTAFQEYWYDIPRQIWSGPHTFPANYIQPYGNSFIMAAQGVPSLLWQSDSVQNVNSSFVENGQQLNWTYSTVLLPDTDQMGNIHLSQSLLDCALTSFAPPINIVAQDQNQSVIDNVSLAGGSGGAVWGGFKWGETKWGVSGNALTPRIVPWHFPLVFSKAQFIVSGQSAAPVRLGAWHFRYKQLRALTDVSAAA